MSWIRGKLADHVGDHVVLSPEKGVLVTSPGTESSYPRLPQALNNSAVERDILARVVPSRASSIGPTFLSPTAKVYSIKTVHFG